MLMLVVTIIIAAVVSAFAGGMGSAQQQVPQATLKADYSQSEGITISHGGGDTLTIGEFKIYLTPSSNMYSIESDSYVTEIDQKLISNGESDTGTMWYDSVKGARKVSRLASGDIAVINVTNCNTQKLTPSLMYYGKNYGINNTDYLGSTFFLEFTTNDGKRIARIEVPIKP